MTPYLPADLTVTVHSVEPYSLYLAIAGELDYTTTAQFTYEVNEALDSHRAQQGPVLKDLHLDWSSLTGIDSSALTALLLLHRRAHPEGITLHLHRQPAQMTRILELTGVAGYLTQDAPTVHPPGDSTPDEPTETDVTS
ncbi:STAS domain-containing protein [Streptomyces flavochromogenes]|uniref:STAS domain-containing protein n=1 Tax=Streptomyces flavochromogenes TaxID=68199 RepID=A0ABW6Y0T7_9ACTN|nr:STAS domain-containing protein [Streptomyces flavochromogenes]